MLSALRPKLIILVIFLLGIITGSLAIPKEVAAQGTYKCYWTPISDLSFCSGENLTKNCDPGYQPPAGANVDCTKYTTQAECERPRQCVLAPQKPGECLFDGKKGIPTALGCIPTEDLNTFASWFLKWAIGIGGGIAFLLILWSGFQIMTSAGNPERLKAGKEQLTAAITGLLFLIFSVFLLRLIGVEILRIPGF